MVKKIVEIPEGAKKIVFSMGNQVDPVDDVNYMLENQVNIDDLDDYDDGDIFVEPLFYVKVKKAYSFISQERYVHIMRSSGEVMFSDAYDSEIFQAKFNREEADEIAAGLSYLDPEVVLVDD